MIGGVQNGRYLGAGPGIRARIDYWLNLWRTAIWGILPPMWIMMSIGYWFTGVSLIQVIDFEEAIFYFGPLWFARGLGGWLFAGRQQPFVSDAVWMLLSPLWVTETARAILGSRARFKVTDKAQHREGYVVHWRLLPFHGILAVLLVVGLLYGTLDPTAPTYKDGFFQSNTFVSLWFLLVIMAGLAPLIEAPKRRTADRYPTAENVTTFVEGEKVAWQCRDISLGGVLVRTDGCERVPTALELELAGIGPVRAEFVRSPAKGLAAFAFRSADARPALVRKLYGSDDYIAAPERWGFGTAVLSFFKRILF
jgi:hypothetical protein